MEQVVRAMHKFMSGMKVIKRDDHLGDPQPSNVKTSFKFLLKTQLRLKLID